MLKNMKKYLISTLACVMAAGIAFAGNGFSTNAAEKEPGGDKPLIGVEQKGGDVHIVVDGESLCEIAKEIYGKASAYDIIFEANKDILDNPGDLLVGEELKIPEVFVDEDGNISISMNVSGNAAADKKSAKDAKTEETATKKAKTVKTEEEKPEEGKSEKAEPEETKIEEVKTEKGKTEEVKAEKAKTEKAEEETEVVEAETEESKEEKTEKKDNSEEESETEAETETESEEEPKAQEKLSGSPDNKKTSRKADLDRLSKVIDKKSGIEEPEAKAADSNDTKEKEVADDKTPKSSKPVSYDFKNWEKDSKTIERLTNYIESVTDEASEDFIPVEDRIAVFDFDGTLYGELAPTYFEWMMFVDRVCEDDSHKPSDFELEVAKTLIEGIEEGFPEGFDIEVIEASSEAFAGMSEDEYIAYVEKFADSAVTGFEDLTWKDLFFKPMVEVTDYLAENDFQVYICSGSDREAVRTMAGYALDIPPSRIIGSDDIIKASGQNDENNLDYIYSKGDKLVRTGDFISKNLQMNKVSAIRREIGKRPVLAFGNSGGDFSMASYVVDNNKYKSEAFIILADDEERDYGSETKSLIMEAAALDNGFNVISEKKEWSIIY